MRKHLSNKSSFSIRDLDRYTNTLLEILMAIATVNIILKSFQNTSDQEQFFEYASIVEITDALLVTTIHAQCRSHQIIDQEKRIESFAYHQM
ncbi:hypothetical protein SS50377_24277 [Spironucleus salmonicida]|uniref:Uncharacterized protein n=1 Tax=Spironucleus salmonicida TaxID=348837 RepID=A0A9P8RYU9_9EUKA|nr:hypothetical protein SS50377_24277 [Spironucleus salmonicida]